MSWTRITRWCLLAAVCLTPASAARPTAQHEPGRCAMRGQCGSESIFGSELPCLDNGLADSPSDDARAKLLSICGDQWRTGNVCCTEAQLDTLRSNLKQADKIIGTCPACKTNFYNLFCTFTCSPDQSLFVNVTDTGTSRTDQTIVTELENVWDAAYGTAFYASCQDVTFGPGLRAMDLIGGGAKNHSQFLSFLGQKRLGGSPFQINFPDEASEGMEAANPKARSCNDTDQRYRCQCSDCPDTCVTLPSVAEDNSCYVGYLPCLSFASIIIFTGFVVALAGSIGGHFIYKHHTLRQQERLRLLQDTSVSDDEDETEEVYNAGLLDRPQRNYRLNSICDTAFARLGGACARYPFFTIGVSLVAVAFLSLGWINFHVEKDPVNLWVSSTSAAFQEKQFFDSNFGPFYRAEQVFLVNDSQSTSSPVLSYETLEWWFEVEKRIRDNDLNNISIDQVCFNPTGDGCVIQSVTGYFGGNFDKLKPKGWQKKIRDCAGTPADCLPPYGAPQDKNLLFGGWTDDDVITSQALITTWVVNNHAKGSPEEARAMQWEAGLRDILHHVSGEAQDRDLRLSFSTEISLEEELNQSANTDASIVVVSYIIMFIYASFALGSATISANTLRKTPVLALIHSKFTLGISGIVIVLLSVSASVGLFSALGIKVTLIIAEVIPFLVLAVGVDNIFLIVHEFERVNQNYPDEEIDSRIAKALGRMGPSILLSASTETIAFVLGVFVGMPAVRNFAAYAAGAVLINALLQVTMFVSVLALNQKRVESNRIDCVPFVKVAQSTSIGRGAYSDESEGPIQGFLRRSYAPALLDPKVKVAVIAFFAAAFTAGVALLPYVSLGLDQRLAIPQGSYLIDYFSDVYDYLNIGPPVYFVARDVDVSKRPQQEALCGRFTTCDEFSLTNILTVEAQRSDVSYITGGTANWFDDFFTWLNPLFDECCVQKGQPCFEGRNPPWNVTLNGMPEDDEFLYWVQKWLDAPSDYDCPLGGKAAYSNAVVVDEKHTSVPISQFRTAHTPLRSQSDFINAYQSARRIAAEISEHQDIDVFPYSIFYIFFDQYASIVGLASALLGTAAGLILLVTTILLGSLATGAIVTLTVTMIVVDIIGTMAIAGVSLNALSLVNLIISVGIGVEFCAHIARAFMFPSRTILEQAKAKYRGHDARAWTALVNVGGSVFSGITITKLLGVCVLAFTRSKIFEVYYFRIWLALVIWAALHALVFLPVALSIVGGDGYIDPESEGGLNGDLSSRRYRALIAEEDDSDDEY